MNPEQIRSIINQTLDYLIERANKGRISKHDITRQVENVAKYYAGLLWRTYIPHDIDRRIYGSSHQFAELI